MVGAFQRSFNRVFSKMGSRGGGLLRGSPAATSEAMRPDGLTPSGMPLARRPMDGRSRGRSRTVSDASMDSRELPVRRRSTSTASLDRDIAAIGEQAANELQVQLRSAFTRASSVTTKTACLVAVREASLALPYYSHEASADGTRGARGSDAGISQPLRSSLTRRTTRSPAKPRPGSRKARASARGSVPRRISTLARETSRAIHAPSMRASARHLGSLMMLEEPADALAREQELVEAAMESLGVKTRRSGHAAVLSDASRALFGSITPRMSVAEVRVGIATAGVVLSAMGGGEAGNGGETNGMQGRSDAAPASSTPRRVVVGGASARLSQISAQVTAQVTPLSLLGRGLLEDVLMDRVGSSRGRGRGLSLRSRLQRRQRRDGPSERSRRVSPLKSGPAFLDHAGAGPGSSTGSSDVKDGLAQI